MPNEFTRDSSFQYMFVVSNMSVTFWVFFIFLDGGKDPISDFFLLYFQSMAHWATKAQILFLSGRCVKHFENKLN